MAGNLTKTILIIGAGEFGLTSALALTRRDWQVTVMEAGNTPRPIAASTDISKVVRMDYGADEAYTRMGELAIEGWHRWNHDWQRTLYHEDGFLIMTRQAMRPGTFEGDTYALLTKRGRPLKQISADEIARSYPAWAQGGFIDGYFNPVGGWAESGQVIAQLAHEVRKAGVVLQENIQLDRLLEKEGRVIGALGTDGIERKADYTLLATGAWTPTLLPELREVMWATGQPILHFQVTNPSDFQAPHFPVWAADIARTGWYGFPALADGTLKLANHGPGRRVKPDDARTVTEEEVARGRAFLSESLPSLADAPLLSSRLCLYCDTFDGNFWIDHHPNRHGLIVVAGDSGHAFKFAPVMGDLIADVVETKDNPFKARFRWRSPSGQTNEGARWSGKES